ncbi:MAG: hypothetical protein Q8L51_02570 [Candidatus Amesbacteria bacterium]|nr:hypothetical protein [Candidatus Amesbacteria bacterium]
MTIKQMHAAVFKLTIPKKFALFSSNPQSFLNLFDLTEEEKKYFSEIKQKKAQKLLKPYTHT